MVLAIIIAAFAIHLIRSGDEPVGGQASTQRRQSLAGQVLAKARPLVDREQYTAAIELMQAYVRSEPDDIEVRPLLAQALMHADEYETAEKTIDQVLLRAPNMARALWLKGRLVAKRAGKNPADYFIKATESPDVSPEILAACGLEMLLAGELDKASETLSRARERGIDDARTLGPLGEIALRRGRFSQAQELLATAVKEVPNNTRMWLLLAESQKQQGNLDTAIQTLQEAASLLQESAVLYMVVGRYAMELGRPTEALKAFSIIIEGNLEGVDDQIRATAALWAVETCVSVGDEGLALSYLKQAGELGADKDSFERAWNAINAGANGQGAQTTPAEQ